MKRGRQKKKFRFHVFVFSLSAGSSEPAFYFHKNSQKIIPTKKALLIAKLLNEYFKN